MQLSGFYSEQSEGQGSPRSGGSYKDLKVWQKSMDLVAAVYDLTDTFPKTETYGLMAQMQRAAVAIPSKLYYCRRSKKRS